MSFNPEHAVVWTEIPVSDLDAGIAFYNKVFDWGLSRDDSGTNPMAMIPTRDGPEGGVAGHLYPGKPASDGNGPTVHFDVPDTLEAAMERVRAAGGKVGEQIIPLPMGRFCYANDPDGNSIGLFQHS